MGDDAKYDQVVILLEGGQTRRMTRAQYLAAPLMERVGWLLEDKTKFYMNGVEVPVNEAVKK